MFHLHKSNRKVGTGSIFILNFLWNVLWVLKRHVFFSGKRTYNIRKLHYNLFKPSVSSWIRGWGQCRSLSQIEVHLRYLAPLLSEVTLNRLLIWTIHTVFLGCVEERRKWIGSPLCSQIDSLGRHLLSLFCRQDTYTTVLEVEFSCSQRKLHPNNYSPLQPLDICINILPCSEFKKWRYSKVFDFKSKNIFKMDIFVNIETHCNNLLILKQNILCEILSLKGKSCL